MSFDAATFMAIIVVYAMIVISPGPNFVLVTRYSLRESVRLSFAVTIGLAIGATINASITMFGVGALILAVPLSGFIISLFGGGFLIYLGISAIKSSLGERRMAAANAALTRSDGAPVSGHAQVAPMQMQESYLVAMQKGLLVNLLNPKGIVFFIGLYAPLVAKTGILTKSAILVASFFIELIWYGFVILFLSRPRFRRVYQRGSFAFDLLMALLLILIGLRVLIEARSFLEAI